MATRKVIPILKLGTGRQAQMNEAHLRLEHAGFMRMMAIGEPRLSELVEKFKAKGYETRVLPFIAEESEAESVEEAGCAADGASAQFFGTIYVRKCAPQGEISEG